MASEANSQEAPTSGGVRAGLRKPGWRRRWWRKETQKCVSWESEDEKVTLNPREDRKLRSQKTL